MKDKRHRHQQGRNQRGFEAHRSGKSSRPGRPAVRKGGAWRFFDAGHRGPNPFEPHFRLTARTRALPGKHLRTVVEPVRSMHGKTL